MIIATVIECLPLCYSFILSFKKYVLSTYYVPSIVLGARDTAMNTTDETDRDPEAPAQSGERRHNIKITSIVANGLKESKEGQSEK